MENSQLAIDALKMDEIKFINGKIGDGRWTAESNAGRNRSENGADADENIQQIMK